MDIITEFAFNIKNDTLTSVSLLINDNIVFALLVLALLFVAERRNEKRLKVIIALVLVSVFTFAIKAAMAIERPCVPLGVAYCPEEYSFPSIHAAVAFTLMIAFLDKKQFPLFLLFALFISFSRLNLAVHSFRDIAGAMPIALIAYYVVDVLWRRYWNERGK